VSDEAELQALVEAYAAAADAREGGLFASLFLDDAVLTTVPGGGRYEGRAAIAAIPGKLAVYTSTDHRVGASRFALDGASATGTTACEAHHVRDGVDKVMTITYHDRFRRDADGPWRFARREVHVEQVVEVPVDASS